MQVNNNDYPSLNEIIYFWTVSDLEEEFGYGGYGDVLVTKDMLNFLRTHLIENDRLDIAVRAAFLEAMRAYDIE